MYNFEPNHVVSEQTPFHFPLIAFTLRCQVLDNEVARSAIE